MLVEGGTGTCSSDVYNVCFFRSFLALPLRFISLTSFYLGTCLDMGAFCLIKCEHLISHSASVCWIM